MNTFRLIDLDELVLTVRNQASRTYVLEAVNAYRGGTYRAAVIATWIAVAYDIIEKIRELAGQGDANAIQFIANLDTAINEKNLKQLQITENSLLEKARDDFEFLSTHEFVDLRRLMEDRNSCAHPAFVENDVLFQPTPEIVRAHIVHSVFHLLRHQPVQGRSALNRITVDLKGNLFSIFDSSGLKNYLTERYLKKSKETLIRNLIITLIKDIFNKIQDFEIWRSLAALSAIKDSNPNEYEKTMREKVPYIFSSVPEDGVLWVFRLLSQDNRVWTWLHVADQMRIKSALNSIDFFNQKYENIYIFGSWGCSELREDLLAAMDRLQPSSLLIISELGYPEFVDHLISRFVSVDRWATATEIGNNHLLHLFEKLTPAQVKRILEGAIQNNQIYGAPGMSKILQTLFERTKDHLPITSNSWKAFVSQRSTSTGGSYAGLREKLEEAGLSLNNDANNHPE
jgi:hypothetical protein